MSDIDVARAYYAEELRAVANLQSEALVRAFAKVPREHFLGPGPWQILSPAAESYWTTNGMPAAVCSRWIVKRPVLRPVLFHMSESFLA
ncbi:MAG TPA: hypothetical protein VMO00_18340 [Methylomirabilota bacterium]|nr:hypothetical protein [Methylomirabilota bacterium]